MENTNTVAAQDSSGIPAQPHPRRGRKKQLLLGAGVLALVIATTFALAPRQPKLPPSVEFNGIPVPFGFVEQADALKGSVTFIANQGGLDIFQVDYPAGTDVETLGPDKVYLVLVPNDPAIPSGIPFEMAVTGSNGPVDYFGYQYSDINATVEKANSGSNVFKNRFPKKFFASPDARDNDPAHGSALARFEAANDISFLRTDVWTGGVLLQRSSLYALIVNETGATSLRVRNFPIVCGNGLVQTGESCDDGNIDQGDGCSTTCTLEDGYACDTATPSVCSLVPACGNGFKEGSEACDDGNESANDGCSTSCAVESGFVCNTNTPNVCTTLCGNSALDSGETCDDGNSDAGDGCSATCRAEQDYTCDNDPLPSMCVSVITCGNSELDSGETCDDGNVTPGDGCAANCSVENGFVCDNDPTPSECYEGSSALCGNTQLDTGETCDDADGAEGDGCSAICSTEEGYTCDNDPLPSQCTLDPACGNGFRETGEGCDDGNESANDGCSTSCAVESGFVCNTNTPNVCTMTCGDGVRHPTAEGCDDGNSDAGDGCSNFCQVEVGFDCTTNQPFPSFCEPTVACGNGYRQTGEDCDDGNTAGGDGCSATCTVENGYTCDDDVPNVCTEDEGGESGGNPVCGNGTRETGETCDDGDTTSGDGCSSTCTTEQDYVCNFATPNVCSLKCFDPDGLNIVNKSSVVLSGSAQFPDSCRTESLISEEYCQGGPGGNRAVFDTYCPVGTTCNDGACVTEGAPAPSGAELQCTDSDNGFNLGTAGTTTNSTQNQSDSDVCYTSTGITQLQETYCGREQGNVIHLAFPCPSGTVCSGNACVPE